MVTKFEPKPFGLGSNPSRIWEAIDPKIGENVEMSAKKIDWPTFGNISTKKHEISNLDY